MTIVVTGGGSGGHITPALAVAEALKREHPDTRIVYVIQRGDKLIDIPSNHPSIDSVHTIYAGKFRRYHGEGWKQLLDLPTILKNLRDALLVLMGLWQSYWLLWKLRPAAIFCKGGFVVVPVGLAAAARKIPFITHDSDSIPGLANRIIARWAVAHATGMPKELYPYQQNKTFYTGIPLSANHGPVSEQEQLAFKNDIGVPKNKKVLLVTGGGLGAVRVNDAVTHVAKQLFDDEPDLFIVHVAGRDHEKRVSDAYEQMLGEGVTSKVVVKGFITDMYRFSGAADIVVARAGATAMAEFAVQQKACIVIPNPFLTGGHQLKNAKYWAEQGAIELVTEDALRNDPRALSRAIMALLDDDIKRRKIGKKLAAFARPDASVALAELVLAAAGNTIKKHYDEKKTTN